VAPTASTLSSSAGMLGQFCAAAATHSVFWETAGCGTGIRNVSGGGTDADAQHICSTAGMLGDSEHLRHFCGEG